jgi:hypothetical protein
MQKMSADELLKLNAKSFHPRVASSTKMLLTRKDLSLYLFYYAKARTELGGYEIMAPSWFFKNP